MNKLNETLSQFLSNTGGHIPLYGFVFNLISVAVLVFILSLVYIRFGTSLSNRKLFARNFIMIGMTTMLIISVVKSSLALSLGLVGALSIVRFRAAIKEPEELAYIFLAISVGLGLGADQRMITITGFAIIVGFIWLKSIGRKTEDNQNLVLTISSHNPGKIELDKVVEILRKNCSAVNFKRLDENDQISEASFFVEFDNFENLLRGKAELQSISNSIKITFLDNKGIL
jgi:hypothetical protein